jgi:hypothetical protein
MSSNFGRFASGALRVARQLDGVARKALRNVLIKVNRGQVEKLSGGGDAAPGDYPVPIRTGHLRRSAGFELHSNHRGAVFNTAAYAGAIHKNRTFIDDPVAEVNPAKEYAAQVRGLMARAFA